MQTLLNVPDSEATRSDMVSTCIRYNKRRMGVNIVGLVVLLSGLVHVLVIFRCFVVVL